MGVLSAVQHVFNENAMQARTPACNRLAKANRTSHGPRASLESQAKERVKRTKEKTKGLSKGTKSENKGSKGAKGSCKGETSKTGISSLENLKSETCSESQESVQVGQVYATDTSWIHEEWSPGKWNDGWRSDEWNDDWSSVGWHEDCEHTHTHL